MDKILSMVMNGFIRQFVRLAVDYGIRLAAGKGKPPAEMTAAEREDARKMNDMAKRAKEMQRITRRIL